MGIIKVARASEAKYQFENGLARYPILEGEYADCAFERCVLQAGAKWEPELYKFAEKCQIFLFIKGKGYVATPREAFNITETAVFVPEFDTEKFFIQAQTDLELIHILPVMSEWDQNAMKCSRITLPRFRLLSQGWTYYEPFKGPNVKSLMLLEHRELGRFSMGATTGNGPSFVGEHIHNELEQWYIVLPGASFTYTAAGEKLKMTAGDISYTVHGSPHGSQIDAGEKFDYIWFELCGNGYPGDIA